MQPLTSQSGNRLFCRLHNDDVLHVMEHVITEIKPVTLFLTLLVMLLCMEDHSKLMWFLFLKPKEGIYF